MFLKIQSPASVFSSAILFFVGLTTSAYAGVWAHYSFDTDYTDSSGNGRNGSLVEGLGIPTTSSGGAPAGTVGNSYVTNTASQYKFGGGSMHFSTDRDYVSLPLTTFANGTPWSITLWVKIAAQDAAEPASAKTFDMAMGNVSDNNNFIAVAQASTSRFRNTGNTFQQDFVATGLGTNLWVHLGLVADGVGGFKIYTNGNLCVSATGKDTTFSYNAIGEAYSVNTTANDFDFHGEIDEVWVFDQALDATNVLGLYTANDPNMVLTPPQATTNATQLIKVYLQGGQSNADGRAKTNGLPAYLLQSQPSIPCYYYLTGGAANGDGTLGTLSILQPGFSAQGGGTTFGPELSFGNTLANYYAMSNGVSTNTVTVALIKYAHGGTSLVTQWAANGNSSTNGDGPDYQIFQRVVSAGLARLAATYTNASIELDGMIWVQGESDIDAGAAAATAYGTNLLRFINDVRLTYATNQPYGTNLPFFYSRISTNQTWYSLPADAGYANYLILRAAQNYVAATMAGSNVFMLNIDGPQFSTLTPYASPGLHFDTGGQQAIGAAFGEAIRTALPLSRMSALQRSGINWNLSFTGVTGTAHTVERAATLAGPWTALTNIVMNPLGYTNYVDTSPPVSNSYYRARRP